MPKLCPDKETARKVAEVITKHWSKDKRSHAEMVRDVTALLANAADCPECVLCCAAGVCCQLGSEEQLEALTNLILKDGTA